MTDIEVKIENLKEELYACMERYKLTDHRTVSKSQELDILLNIYEKGREVCA